MTKMWLKRVLVPFWIVDLVLFVIILGVGCVSAVAWSKVQQDLKSSMTLDANARKLVIKAGVIAIAVTIVISALSIIIDVTTIVLFTGRKLNPAAYLVMQVIKFIFFAFIFVADIIEFVKDKGETVGLGWIFSIVLFASSLGQLLYGSVIMHRKRKGLYSRGNYRNVEGGGKGLRTFEMAHHKRDSLAAAPYDSHGPMAPNPFRDQSREPSPEPSARVPLTAQR